MAHTDHVVRAFVCLLASGFLFFGTASALMDVDRRPDPAMFPPGTVIAVDLGNTNSCVAGYVPGDTETTFQFCIPSWVAFADDGTVLVGEEAENHAAVNPHAAISGFKRLLGKRLTHVYEREFVQRVNDNLPYKVVEKEARPHVHVKTNDGVVKHVGIEQITAMVFAKLKETAEAHLGRRVHAAILTLPQHNSNYASRDTALYAGTDAGFDAMRVLHEPIAAAIAYGLHRNLREEGNVLVLHIGGSTAEATVMTFVDGVYEILGADHDPFFGGQDFDRRIMDHFIELIREKHGKNISAPLRKLRMACEQAKKTLSDQDHAQVIAESLVDGVDLSEPLTRAKFEELNHDLFLKVVELVDRAVISAEIAKSKDVIDEVVLVGGSTMIPKIWRLVKEHFDGKEPHTGLKPDEAVTLGAVYYSKWLYNKRLALYRS
ncbi:hypothetical protein ACP70R_014654 [Stipagrostis hirtigluma subsp. patula]